MLVESTTRSLAKAISWRLTGSLDTFVISWAITGNASIATSIATIEVVTKIFYYWVHERIWNQIKWGRQ